jgi:hypothetical protein
MFSWITKDIKELLHTLKRSKTMEKLNQIKSDNKDLHGSIVVLYRWGFILNVSWEINYTLIMKIKLTPKEKLN